MCQTPGVLPDGTRVACRKCWQCRENAVNDWVGRCIAESKTAPLCDVITFTYGRDEFGNEDHPRAKVLTYSDVQKFWKILRFHGYPPRYFVVGEYGSEKGRSHWHAVVYWPGGKRPPLYGIDQYGKEGEQPLGRRFNWKRLDAAGRVVGDWWKYGFVQFEEVTPASIRYNTKYIQKDIGKAERQGHLMMSKQPPLGSDYFRREAERYVEQGLAPQDLFYSYPEALDKQGRRVQFMLRGKTAQVFVEHYAETWERRRPGRPMPHSELVEDMLDPGSYSRKGDAARLAENEYQDRHAQRAWRRSAASIDARINEDQRKYG